MIAEEQIDNFAIDPYCRLYLPLWKLDGDSFMSRDAYGHLCTNHGTVWTPQGRQFVNADEDYIDCGSNPGLDITGEITAEIWYFEEARINYAKLVASSKDTANKWFFAVSGGQPYGYVLWGGSDAITSKTFTIPLKSWSHLVWRYSDGGNFLKIYYNGMLKETKATSLSIGTGKTEFVLGVDSPIHNYWVSGLIGLVTIYNRDLTLPEITEHYLVGKEIFG